MARGGRAVVDVEAGDAVALRASGAEPTSAFLADHALLAWGVTQDFFLNLLLHALHVLFDIFTDIFSNGVALLSITNQSHRAWPT